MKSTYGSQRESGDGFSRPSEEPVTIGIICMAAWLDDSGGICERFGVKAGTGAVEADGWVVALSRVTAICPLAVGTKGAAGEAALHPARIKSMSTHIQTFFSKGIIANALFSFKTTDTGAQD